jgi:hypothetical protein
MEQDSFDKCRRQLFESDPSPDYYGIWVCYPDVISGTTMFFDDFFTQGSDIQWEPQPMKKAVTVKRKREVAEKKSHQEDSRPAQRGRTDQSVRSRPANRKKKKYSSDEL